MFQHKRINLILLSAFITCAANAGALHPRQSAAPVREATPLATSDLRAYYHTPEGVTFMGADQNCALSSDMAFAPVGKWLQTAAEATVGNARFGWKFPTAVAADQSVSFDTSTQENLQFRMSTACVVPAPMLTATSGLSSATYTMAADGITYGQIGTYSNYAVNYQPGQTVSFLTSSTCHPKIIGKKRGDALVSFHQHCFADCLLVLG